MVRVAKHGIVNHLMASSLALRTTIFKNKASAGLTQQRACTNRSVKWKQQATPPSLPACYTKTAIALRFARPPPRSLAPLFLLPSKGALFLLPSKGALARSARSPPINSQLARPLARPLEYTISAALASRAGSRAGLDAQLLVVLLEAQVLILERLEPAEEREHLVIDGALEIIALAHLGLERLQSILQQPLLDVPVARLLLRR